MSRKAVVALGVTSLLPWVLIALYVPLFGAGWVSFNHEVAATIDGGPAHTGPSGLLIVLAIADLLLACACAFVSVGVCLVHALAFDRAPFSERAVWALLLLFGSILTAPVYVYVVLWRGRPATGTVATA